MTATTGPARVSPDELRAWMAERNLSAYALAQRLGVSGGAVSLWLNDLRPIPAHLRLTLAGIDAENTRQP